MSQRRDLSVIDRSADPVVLTRAQARLVDWSIDILVYTVVLNLFVEYVESVVIDSFTISLLTAILIKVILVLLIGVEERVREFFHSKGTAAASAVGAVVVVAILIGGKLLILEIVDLVFGGRVELGHFVEVLLLIIAMLAVRRLMDRLFDRLGNR
ncbi:MAG: hypothetical protein ACR2QK_04735 [Acidimicrobiales bacterium]